MVEKETCRQRNPKEPMIDDQLAHNMKPFFFCRTSLEKRGQQQIDNSSAWIQNKQEIVSTCGALQTGALQVKTKQIPMTSSGQNNYNGAFNSFDLIF